MKKLILIPAIVLAALVFNKADAQEHVQFRNHVDMRAAHYPLKPRFENNFREERVMRDEHFYREQRRHDDFVNYRGRRY